MLEMYIFPKIGRYFRKVSQKHLMVLILYGIFKI